MKHWTRWLAMGVAVVLSLAAADASAAYAQAGPTVGQFVTMVVSQTAGTPVTLDQALKAMRRLGISIKDPDAALDQQTLARIMRTFGFRCEGKDPNTPVDFNLANGSLYLLSTGFLGGSSGGSSDFSAPLDVGVCLDEPNFGLCVACCVRQGSRPPGGGFPGSVCTQFCSTISPSPSMATRGN